LRIILSLSPICFCRVNISCVFCYFD
jgi:hypothetical protein